jgi:hypothetical protein
MTPEEERIRSYLVAQAAKLSPAAIVEKVQAAMADLRQAAVAVPAARFGDRPGGGEWSANAVMAHVLASGRYFGEGIAAIISGRPPDPRPERPSPEGGPLRTAQAWCDELERDRSALFARAIAADPGARLDHTIQHPAFGPLDWRASLLFLRLHDMDHTEQLRKIAAALA